MDRDFDIIESIKRRRSVRTFSVEHKLTAEQLANISDYIKGLDNPFGVKDISIGLIQKGTANSTEKLGTYGVIKGADTFLSLAVKDAITSLVAGAYEFETLVLWLTSLGIGTVWLGGTFNRKAFSDKADLPSDMILPIVSPIGYAEKPRLTERIMRKVSKADNRKPWDKMFFNNTIDRPLSEVDAERFAVPLEMLRLAPSAVNAQPWRVIKQGDELYFYVDFSDKIGTGEKTLKYIDMGIALCHFGLTAKSLDISGGFYMAEAPNITVPSTYHYIATWL